MIVTDYFWQLSTNNIRFRFYNEVKWNLTQLTRRRAVACCRSAVSAWWLKRGKPCLHHLHVLCTAFPGGLSLRLPIKSFFSFFYPHPSSSLIFPLINQSGRCLVPFAWGSWLEGAVYRGLACSRRSVSRVRCSDGGEWVKSYTEETRGKERGESEASFLPFPFSLPFLFSSSIFRPLSTIWMLGTG